MRAAGFDQLAGFAQDDSLAAFEVLRRAAREIVADAPPLRPAQPAAPELRVVAEAALAASVGDAESARAFFVAHFEPRSLGPGFLTGYYEPWVDGALEPSPDFAAPLLARPADIGKGEPPTRAEIEAAGRNPVAFVRDAVEAYLIQVQGSARLRLPDGSWRRLVYDGRNGRPYTSIGRLLIEAGEIPEREMSLARLKAWARARPEAARALMRRNESFVYFRLADDGPGPIGGAGRPLTPLRSLAVDRALWSYGLPFYVRATLPWRDDAPALFRRLMIAEDTGTAIVGAARADLFFGGGDAAGALAGAIRHAGDLFVLWPKGAPS